MEKKKSIKKKPTTKKKTVVKKKSPTKKKPTKVKEQSTAVLSNVNPENAFWCVDGRIFSNLEDLGRGMEKMLLKTYKYHVNLEKNDFANWVEEIIGDKTLSSGLKKAKDKKSAVTLIKKRVKSLSK